MRELAIVAMFAVACSRTVPTGDTTGKARVPGEARVPATATQALTTFTNIPRPNPRRALRVGGDVIAPVIVRRVDPVYPEYRGTYRQGILVLECVITEEGVVSDLRVVKGPGNSFEQAILDAVKQWKFKPGSLHGEPVPVIYDVTVNHVPYGPGG